MTPQERDLILSVFDRLSRLTGGAKDREAEALIQERMRAVPDAAYNLVEAVVVQEMAIKEHEVRIRDLEAQLAQVRQGQAAPQPSGGGFGRSGNPWGRGSVPSTAPQQAQQQQQYAPPPQQPYPPQQYPQPSPWGQPSAGGSFLRTAAGAAVGVAGGMMLANGLSSLFAGGHGAAQAAAQPINETINNFYGNTPQAGGEPQVSYDSTVSDDQGYADYDPGFDMGGDDSF